MSEEKQNLKTPEEKDAILEKHLPKFHRQPSEAKLKSMSLDSLFSEFGRDYQEMRAVKEGLREASYTTASPTKKSVEAQNSLVTLQDKAKDLKSRITQKVAAESVQSSDSQLAEALQAVSEDPQVKEWQARAQQGQTVYQLDGVQQVLSILEAALAPKQDQPAEAPAQEEGQSDGQA